VSAAAWNWRWTSASALLYTLAFNLTFFIQELFLVLPKAAVPGLRPTLFHNNHRWEGDSPLAALFQGTGALATLLAGIGCAVLLRRGAGKSAGMRLFLFWMAFSGIFMALPQVVIGALSEQSDIGMAMVYFGLGATSKKVAALLALALVPLAARSLGLILLAQVGNVQQVGAARFLLRYVTVPGLLALPLIVLFRVPREWIEVLMVPLVVTVVGLVAMHAVLWRASVASAGAAPAEVSLARPLAGVLALLLIFQLLLRPGVHFY